MDIVHHRQNNICKGSILNLKSLNEFMKVSTIFKVPVNFFEHTATMSPVLFMIKAIEMVKTYQHTVGHSEADTFAMKRVNPICRVDHFSKSELTRLAGLPHFR